MRTQAQAKQADHIQYLKERARTLHPLEYRAEMNRIAKLEKENNQSISKGVEMDKTTEQALRQYAENLVKHGTEDAYLIGFELMEVISNQDDLERLSKEYESNNNPLFHD